MLLHRSSEWHGVVYWHILVGNAENIRSYSEPQVLLGVLRACACNRYQATFSPPLRGLGTRLGQRKGNEGVKLVWLWDVVVASLTQEMRSALCVGSVMEPLWWICVHFGSVKAVWFLRDCLWASGGLPVASQHIVENGGRVAQGVVVVGVVWPFPSGFLTILKWTFLASTATPQWFNGSGWKACTSLMTLMWFWSPFASPLPTH